MSDDVEAAETFNPEREADYTDWRTHVILGDGDTEAVAHEAFCAGWEAARERISRLAAERQAGTLDLNGHWIPFTEKLSTHEQDRECAEHARVCSLPFGHQGGHWWDERAQAASRSDGEPRAAQPGGEEDAGGEAGKQAREHEGTTK